jgi:hypothetical protein
VGFFFHRQERILIEIAVCIGEVDTHIATDQVLSFDAIESLLTRAAQTTLLAYNAYMLASEEFETVTEDESE